VNTTSIPGTKTNDTDIVGESDDYVDTAEDRKQEEYNGDEQYYSDNGYEKKKRRKK
jgi:hypothetical protein